MKKIKLFSLCILTFIMIIVFRNFYMNRPIVFNKEMWNNWDVIYSERRYNMAIWFFRESWFNGMTKDTIHGELSDNRGVNHIIWFYGEHNENNIILFDLKYSNEFMERWNIDFDFKPIAYLKIFYDENENIIRVELLEGKRKNHVREYIITRYWNIE